MTRLRLQLEGGVQFLLAQLVIWIGVAVGNVYPWNLPVGRIVRWAVLAELGVFAVAYAVTAPGPLPRPGRVAAAVGGFLALAFLSVGWSPHPSLTFGRTVSTDHSPFVDRSALLSTHGFWKARRRLPSATPLLE